MTSRALTGLAVGLVLLVVALPQASPPSGSRATGPATFTIDSSIAVALSSSPTGTRCSGPPATLAPGVTRCLVYRVDNRMGVPITVQRITIGLDPAVPPPPPGCTAEDLALPTFTGSFLVPAGASATSPGLPISLKETSTNQDSCKDSVLRFVFSGTAVSGDSTQQGTQPGAGPLAFTGANMLTVALVGCVLVGMGVLLVVTARRTRGRDGAPR